MINNELNNWSEKVDLIFKEKYIGWEFYPYIVIDITINSLQK